MAGNNAAVDSMEIDECLENRLKEAAPQDLGQLVEEFLKAFYLDTSDVAGSRLHLAHPDRGLQQVTFQGHMTL